MSGTLSLSQMKSEVRYAFGNTTEHDSRLTYLFTLAQQKMIRRHDFEELKVRGTIGTTADTGDESADMLIALPSGLRQLYSAVLIDGLSSWKLIAVNPRSWESTVPYPEELSRGKPSHYKRWANYIQLWRVPNAAYVIRGHYSTWGTAFVNETDVSSIDYKDELLILLVQVWISSGQDRPDRTNYFWAMFKTAYEEAFGQDMYQSDLNAAGEGSRSSVDNYWLNPAVNSHGGEQVE